MCVFQGMGDSSTPDFYIERINNMSSVSIEPVFNAWRPLNRLDTGQSLNILQNLYLSRKSNNFYSKEMKLYYRFQNVHSSCLIADRQANRKSKIFLTLLFKLFLTTALDIQRIWSLMPRFLHISVINCPICYSS